MMKSIYGSWAWQLNRLAHSLLKPLYTIWLRPSEWYRFWKSYFNYYSLAAPNQKPKLRYFYPRLGDDTNVTRIDPTYYYQDAWAFELIALQRPAWHVDVGSHHKYVALLSKVVPVIMVDIRPLKTSLATLDFRLGSILELPFPDASVPSVSSLCVIEHIGLGRYGDPIDPTGSEKAVAELKRVVQRGGSVYISAPLDDENRTYFNAHRAFHEDYLLSLFAPLEVVEKRYIYGYQFVDQKRPGLGTGCYHFKYKE